MTGLNPALVGWLQAVLVLAVLGVGHVPLGDYMARVFTSTRHWRLEKLVYRLTGLDPTASSAGRSTCWHCWRSPELGSWAYI